MVSHSVGLCVACLAPRHELGAAELERAAQGRARTTACCADDLAFPAVHVTVSTPCAACGNSSDVLVVAPATAQMVARYLAGFGSGARP